MFSNPPEGVKGLELLQLVVGKAEVQERDKKTSTVADKDTIMDKGSFVLQPPSRCGVLKHGLSDSLKQLLMTQKPKPIPEYWLSRSR